MNEFIEYFKSSGFVDTRFITKDGIDIILRLSGLDYLHSSEKTTDKPKLDTQERKEFEKRIFLAHASEDKIAVRKLYRKLKENGLEPWLDEENLHPGVRWDDEIKKAIKIQEYF
ncbi:MAG: toll/interleukin-1 receptor domain-containing protein [Lewinellaceae bacterium]|nr:toll/interleukin-1 receptor domain-containing protein [Lewinellaceae bacterium]